MKQTALPALALLATAPAYGHHEYSTNEGLLSLITSSPLAIVMMGIVGLVAVRLIARRKTR